MNRNRRRRGYALIELLAVLTISAVMLTLAAGLLHLLMKLDRNGRDALDESADLARLSRAFRADAHASTTFEPTEQTENLCKLQLENGRSVEYQVRTGDLLRTIRDGEKVRGFETFRRPPRTAVKFRLDGAPPRPPGQRPFLILTIDRPPDGRDNASRHDWSIQAELGKDQRLYPRPR